VSEIAAVLTVPPPIAPTRLELPNLLALARRPESIEWQPFHPGVLIHRLYGDGVAGPSAALIWFQDGGVVPLHRHGGYEHVLVLAGSQRDEGGLARSGTLIIHTPGSQHRIVSEEGCIVLAIYERPVEFLE
jgi:anti-sigma factor ChrR (cupin superfamily)